MRQPVVTCGQQSMPAAGASRLAVTWVETRLTCGFRPTGMRCGLGSAHGRSRWEPTSSSRPPRRERARYACDVEPSVIIERLLLVEAEALTIAADCQRLRYSLRERPMVDSDAVAVEVAELAVMARHRSDEVRAWRLYLTRPWWRRFWPS